MAVVIMTGDKTGSQLMQNKERQSVCRQEVDETHDFDLGGHCVPSETKSQRFLTDVRKLTYVRYTQG